MHCDMRFLGEKNSTLLCFLDGFRIAVLVFGYSVINCIITIPDCGLSNGTKLSNFMNYCFFSELLRIQTVHVFTKKKKKKKKKTEQKNKNKKNKNKKTNRVCIIISS